MGAGAATYLLILGEREALAWVLREQRMAFSARRARSASALTLGDRLLLYTTRGCFHNPTRDRGRVIGEGEVTSPVEALPVPVRLAGRTFPLGCAIEVSGLVPLGTGVELSPLVRRLTVFPHQRSWSARLRRPLLQLLSSDVALIRKQLRPMLCAPQDVLDGYVKAVPGRRRDTRFETSRVQIRPSWPGW